MVKHLPPISDLQINLIQINFFLITTGNNLWPQSSASLDRKYFIWVSDWPFWVFKNRLIQSIIFQDTLSENSGCLISVLLYRNPDIHKPRKQNISLANHEWKKSGINRTYSNFFTFVNANHFSIQPGSRWCFENYYNRILAKIHPMKIYSIWIIQIETIQTEPLDQFNGCLDN